MKVHLILLILVSYTNISWSQNWTGNQDADWNNAANWSSWPLNGEDITINPALYTGNSISPVISSNSVFSPAAMLIENGGILTIEANLTTVDDVEVIGAGSLVEVNSGTFSVNPGAGGRLIIDLNAAMTINGGTTIVDERFIAGEDVLVTINGGSASSGERLIMDLGGRFIQNNGNVSVAATFAMADGSLNNNSSYVLNDGTLTVTGEFAMENESGIFEPSFTQNGGTLAVNGDVIWFGEAPGSGTPRFIMNSGDAMISGIMHNLPLSTVNMYMEINGDANLVFNGTLIENIQPTDSILQLGSSSFIFNNTNAINNMGVFLAEDVITEFNGNTTLQGSGTYQFSSVLIQPAATLTHQSPLSVNVSGDFEKNGVFNANLNELVFNGNGLQTLSGSSAISLYNVEVFNTSLNGVELNIPVEISGHFELTDGVVFTDAVNVVTAVDNATSSSGNLSSYVDGPFTKIGDDPFVFPVGKNGVWSRIGISAPSNLTDEFTAEYFNTSYPSITPVNSPLSAVSNLEYWELNQTGISQVEVTLHWEDALASSISDCAELSIGYWNGSSWDNVLSTATGVCTGNGSGSIASNSALSNFGVFSLGFYSGVTSQSVSICSGESYTIGSNTYTMTGSYIDVLQDINMADSVVLTNLTVVEPNIDLTSNGVSVESDQPLADAYQWLDCATNYSEIIGETAFSFTPSTSGYYSLEIEESGCVDTTDCFYYQLVDTTICSGSQYDVGTNSYVSAGNYVDVLTSSNVLDSIIVSAVGVYTINTNVLLSGLTITCDNSTAISYQWIDCTTDQPINGEIADSYTATYNGSFAVIVEENGCVDTSLCTMIATVGINDFDALNEPLIYPNPFTDRFVVEVDNPSDYQLIEVLDMLGNTILESTSLKGKMEFTMNQEAGVYFIRLSTINHQIGTYKLIKN